MKNRGSEVSLNDVHQAFRQMQTSNALDQRTVNKEVQEQGLLISKNNAMMFLTSPRRKGKVIRQRKPFLQKNKEKEIHQPKAKILLTAGLRSQGEFSLPT
eukprot:1154227-Pelagomonas_calceolata.AAC.3